VSGSGAGRRSALVVPGHGTFARDGGYRLSARCLRILDFAAEVADEVEPDAVLFSGWSPTVGPSEAAQMLASWPGRRDLELVAEETARTTAENMARSLPLLRARDVESATIVWARTHLVRVRYFFGGVYPRFGIACEFRSPRAALPSPTAVVWEAFALPVMPFQRRAALAELDVRAS
jgi:hypothetical protein